MMVVGPTTKGRLALATPLLPAVPFREKVAVLSASVAVAVVEAIISSGEVGADDVGDEVMDERFAMSGAPNITVCVASPPAGEAPTSVVV